MHFGHQFAWWIAGACTVIAGYLSLQLIGRHLRNYTRPAVQKYIIRIALMVPVCRSLTFFLILFLILISFFLFFYLYLTLPVSINLLSYLYLYLSAYPCRLVITRFALSLKV